jgi:hypothetical protein
VVGFIMLFEVKMSRSKASDEPITVKVLVLHEPLHKEKGSRLSKKRNTRVMQFYFNMLSNLDVVE